MLGEEQEEHREEPDRWAGNVWTSFNVSYVIMSEQTTVKLVTHIDTRWQQRMDP